MIAWITAVHASICGIVYMFTLWQQLRSQVVLSSAPYSTVKRATRAVHSIHSVYLLRLPTRSVCLSKSTRTKTQVEDSMEFRIAKTDLPECDIEVGWATQPRTAAEGV